eukprot:gene46967-biopygen59728
MSPAGSTPGLGSKQCWSSPHGLLPPTLILSHWWGAVGGRAAARGARVGAGTGGRGAAAVRGAAGRRAGAALRGAAVRNKGAGVAATGAPAAAAGAAGTRRARRRRRCGRRVAKRTSSVPPRPHQFFAAVGASRPTAGAADTADGAVVAGSVGQPECFEVNAPSPHRSGAECGGSEFRSGFLGFARDCRNPSRALRHWCILSHNSTGANPGTRAAIPAKRFSSGTSVPVSLCPVPPASVCPCALCPCVPTSLPPCVPCPVLLCAVPRCPRVLCPCVLFPCAPVSLCPCVPVSCAVCACALCACVAHPARHAYASLIGVARQAFHGSCGNAYHSNPKVLGSHDCWIGVLVGAELGSWFGGFVGESSSSGSFVGAARGAALGAAWGDMLGAVRGDCEGPACGEIVDRLCGDFVGIICGDKVGGKRGDEVGETVGWEIGAAVGIRVGSGSLEQDSIAACMCVFTSFTDETALATSAIHMAPVKIVIGMLQSWRARPSELVALPMAAAVLEMSIAHCALMFPHAPTARDRSADALPRSVSASPISTIRCALSTPGAGAFGN